MKAFILAGGFGTRLREVIHGRPKVLAVVQGRPFLNHLILYLKAQGIEEIVLGVGYLASYVRERFGDGSHLGVRIQYSEEPRPLGTAGAIRNAMRLLSDDFLVLNGDTFIDVDVADLVAFHKRRRADVTMVASTTFHGRGGVIKANDHGRVVTFEANAQPGGKAHTNAGIYVFSRKILRLIGASERSFLERDLFPALLRQKYRVFAFPVARDYLDIGSPAGYEQAKKLLRA